MNVNTNDASFNESSINIMRYRSLVNKSSLLLNETISLDTTMQCWVLVSWRLVTTVKKYTKQFISKSFASYARIPLMFACYARTPLMSGFGIPSAFGTTQFLHVSLAFTNCGLLIKIWVNIGSCNGFFPDGTKQLPVPILINNHSVLVTFQI